MSTEDDRRTARLARRLGMELRLARAASGWSQRQLAGATGITQAYLSKVERADAVASIPLLVRLAHAAGSELSVRLYPGHGIGLRDAGQLRLAAAITARLPAGSTSRLEVPVAPPPDRRAADLVVETGEQTLVVEIERRLVDLQEQLRRAQLKRAALAERLGRPAALVFGLSDTRGNRALVAWHAPLVGSAFPVRSAAAWAAIRDGRPLEGDALLWIRPVPAEPSRTSVNRPQRSDVEAQSRLDV